MINWANIWGVLGVVVVGACRQQIQKLRLQEFSLAVYYNIRGTTWKSLEEIKGLFFVETASHPPAPSIVQPALSKAMFFWLIFWVSIMVQISIWNHAKFTSFIDLGLVWQVLMLPKFMLSDVCTMGWGNPAQPCAFVAALTKPWNCTSKLLLSLKLPFCLMKLLNMLCFLNFILDIQRASPKSCIMTVF